ncbi:MAG: hypothetical protein KBC62_04670 [Candidatus Pacebacteria bacterium]|nr:hypothetical protein [Candidatus Paceibacterota bacterium]
MKPPHFTALTNIAGVAGLFVADDFGKPHSVTDKDDGTPVTPIDIQINEYLADRAKDWGHGFLGEEGNGAEDAEYTFFVDPLDGTGAYIRGMATATVIISVMHYGEPISAVIHNPITKQMWVAGKGEGAWYARGDTELVRTYVAKNPQKRWRTAICAWPGVGENFTHFQASVLADSRFNDQQMGAIGLGGGLIASGTLHATAYGATSAVETAAMSLIVREAGGIAIDLLGNPLERFELGEHKGKTDFLLPHGAIIACNQHVAEALLSFY